MLVNSVENEIPSWQGIFPRRIRPERWLFCNSIDLGLVAKGVYASHRYHFLNSTEITNLLALLKLGSLLGASLLLALALLEEGLRHEDLVLGGDGTGVRVSINCPKLR